MAMPSSLSVLAPLAVLSPPDTVPSRAPVATRDQELPFDALSWENFERLCHRLTALEGDVEHCARYGRQGDAQEGIDIYARRADGRYHCLQAKRHRTFGATQLRSAVDQFLDGTWAARAISFTIAVQASLRSIVVQEEIERQVVRLRARGITFVTLDGEDLTARLRHQPVLIDDFFGRPWVVALLGPDVASGLGARLDGDAFARACAQLANVYEAQFQFFDPGSFGSISDEDGRPALTLLERFLKPDILVRETARTPDRAEVAGVEGERSAGSVMVLPLRPESDTTRSSGTVANSRMRRLPLGEWLGDSERLVLLGDAGCGKSTLLRVVALDLLQGQGQAHFPELATRWGQYLPVYIPFAHWSSQVARDGHAIGIKEIVRRSLEHFLTSSIVDLLDRAFDDQRVLLLIDGLDEWSGEQAARATLSALVTTVEAHNVPVIVSGRPRGLSRIGTLPANWKRGTVAPLSTVQQATIARRWFGRYAATEPNGIGLSDASLRTGRFMAELARDANLGALAAVPLLLIGLVTLALRGQILPRTRGDIYDQLVRVLLEVHPENRATASGDTMPRFRHATDPDQRRAAIARLAFAVREQAGGGGMPLTAAREILRTYLTSPQGFDLPDADASAAAGEILSVNAETQGLIVEKAFAEVGFVHASFEEFLCAEHIGGWPFSEIEAFVRTHAGEGRWRNVITYLLGYIQRREEFDRLVGIIEEPEPDDLVRFHRQFLLGDIAFGSAMRATANATVRRLALATMHRVETEDWLPARREALASVLKGLADPTLKVDIEQRLGRWLPARRPYRALLIGAFGAWQPTAQLQDLLFQSMHDEDPGVQRAAAAAYANAFSSSAEACQRLLDGLARTRDLAAAAALLESLALGWPDAPAATPLFEEAWLSHGAELRLVGILGLAATGAASDEARDAVLRGQNHWSDVSYPHHELAATMLMKYWPGDETLVKSALDRVSGNFDSIWEHTTASAYLMESPVDRADVRAWILAELGRTPPFNIMGNNRCWAQVGRFAAADPDIRSAANAYWCEPKNRLIKMHALPNYVAHVADEQVAAAMIEVLGNKEEKFNRYWALSALLTGWGRDHPEVKPAIDALVDAGDEDLDDLVALLPNIVLDKAAARARLIRMGTRSEVRRDLLTIGLEACGCDSADNEAVAAILAFPEQFRGTLAVSYPLFRTFGENNNIRELALKCLREANGPIEAIAACYKDDPKFAPTLFDIAAPLPVDLRTQVVELAATGATGTALEAILGQGMLETDPELRVRMVIAHHRALPPDAHDAARQALLDKAVNVGIDHESIRAAALAGLVTIGALEALVTLEERGKPVELKTGNLVEGIPAIERLICERFEEFEAAFGDSLSDRFKALGNGNRLAEILSAAPGASPAARAAFLTLAERGEILCTPHTLRALAAERPRSDLLLARCWDTIDSRDYSNDRAMVNADVGLILRDHFSGNPGVRQRLVDRFKEAPVIATAIPLAIFAPGAEELPLLIDFDAIGQEFADWTVAVHVAAHRADSTTFCKLLEAMLCRRWRSQFDAQPLTNLAVEERLQWDSELEGMLSARINKDVDPSISGSFARYLAAAGKLSPEARGRTLELLQVFGTDQRLPVGGYDAIADQWRATRATLLDAVFAGLELG